MGINPVGYYDEDDRVAWFIPVIIGAIVGGSTGAFVAETNDIDWWKGAITGAFIGAFAGAAIAPSLGATGMTTTVAGADGVATTLATKSWGITTSIINGANINMGFAALGALKAGICGSSEWLVLPQAHLRQPVDLD